MNRATLIKLVHAGARNLFGDDEEARRAWQKERTGHDSCSMMSDVDMENLVSELRRRKALAPLPKRSGNPQARKIRALWIQMYKDGYIRNGSEQALGQYCHKLTGRYRPEWLTVEDANKVIESLKQWRHRLEQEES